MIRHCKTCGVSSEEASFYNGVSNRCKECHKAKVKANRQAKAEHYKAYDAARFQNDPRVRERHIRYRATPEGRASMNAARQKWLKNNSTKRAAHIILGNSVRDGKIHKPDTCQICGAKPQRIEGHHHDYTKPLDVVWCCRKCHFDIHRQEGI